MDVVIGQISLVSHQLGLLLGGIELKKICCICIQSRKVDAQIREVLLHK